MPSQPPSSPRRRALLRTGSALAALPAARWADAAQGTIGRERASLEASGLAADLPQRLDEGVRSGTFGNLHAVVVVRHGKLALERYYRGPDEHWGRPVGTVDFDAHSLHDLRSVTKSVVGLLYGIAQADGKVPGPGTPLVDAFAGRYPDLARDEARRRMQVRHALDMTLGLDWNEDLPYSDPRNSEIAMEQSADRYRYVLERPIVAEPGTRWRYSGGATALLGRLISEGTGQPLAEFARARLLAPLGIERLHWTPGTNGEAAAASGLRLTSTDLARIGQLLLQRGAWNGAQVVPADWVAESLTPRAAAFEGIRYGYHWYIGATPQGAPVYLAFGWGGQRLVAVPSLGLVCVIFMGNYRRADQLPLVLAVQRTIFGAVEA